MHILNMQLAELQNKGMTTTVASHVQANYPQLNMLIFFNINLSTITVHTVWKQRNKRIKLRKLTVKDLHSTIAISTSRHSQVEYFCYS